MIADFSGLILKGFNTNNPTQSVGKIEQTGLRTLQGFNN